MKFILALVATVVAVSACSHEIVHPTTANTSVATATKGEAVDLSVEWVKNKPNSLDALVWITNRTQKPVFTTTESYKMNFAGTDFAARANEGLVQIPAGAKMKVLLIFEMPEDKARSGKAVLTISPIYQGMVGADTRTKLSDMRIEFNLTGKSVH